MAADARIAAAVDAARTNREGRVLLGLAADYLQQAYVLAAQISQVGDWDWRRILDPFAVEDRLTGVANVEEEARRLLDISNAYAGGIYATLPDDDSALTEDSRRRIGVALNNAYTDLGLVRSVQSDIQSQFIDSMTEAASVWLDAASGAVVSVTKLAAASAIDNVGLLAIAAVGLAGLLFLRKRFA